MAVATAAGWIAIVLLVNPWGPFPMMDDWIFVRAAVTLADAGRLDIPANTQMVAVGHIALGAAIIKLAGFSFDTLRLVILIAAWGGGMATYAALRMMGARGRDAAAGSVAMLVNPIYVVVAGTFMTDIPFYVCSTLALGVSARALRSGRWSDVLLATALGAAGATSRQPAIVVAAAFLLAWPVAHGLSRRALLQAILPFAVVAATLWTIERSLAAAGELPADYNLPLRTMIANLAAPTASFAAESVKRLLNIGFHIGWFAIPFAAVAGAWSRRLRLWLLAAVALLGVAVAATGKVAPWGYSLLYDFGIGGVSLYDITGLHLPHLPRAPYVFWLVLTIASGAALMAIVIQWSAAVRETAAAPAGQDRRVRAALIVLCLAAAAGYIVPFTLSWFYDRYLLTIMPCVMGLAALRAGGGPERGRLRVAAVAVAACALLTIGTIHDYRAWNRARWEGTRFLLERADAEAIDAGYEFAGWYRFREDRQWRDPADRRFVVTFGEVPGYVEVARFPYQQWLPVKSAAMLVLERSR